MGKRIRSGKGEAGEPTAPTPRPGKTAVKASFAFIVVATLTIASSSFAEYWQPLDEYVSKCVLIVKARATDAPDKNGMCTFEILETWKGHFDPAGFATGMAEGNVIRAPQGEHGVQVTRGAEIILFYTRQNQPDQKLHSSSTVFPIDHGKMIYAATSDLLRQEMPLEVFKQRISAVGADIAASTQPAEPWRRLKSYPHRIGAGVLGLAAGSTDVVVADVLETNPRKAIEGARDTVRLKLVDVLMGLVAGDTLDLYYHLLWKDQQSTTLEPPKFEKGKRYIVHHLSAVSHP
jgi:hypothetical protein